MRAKSFIPIILLGIFTFGCVGKLERAKAVELKKLASETPVYPGFQKTGEDLVLKQGIVYLNLYYKSDAKFSEIKKFYDTALQKEGWEPPQQLAPSIFVGEKNYVKYSRGDYVFVVNQGETQPNSVHVVFEWSSD